MSLRAYQQAQQATESPRNTEYRLFAQVTRALMDVKDLPRIDKSLIDAVHWNRRLWDTLMNDCAAPDNQLPEALSAQIISVSIWVRKYSSEVVRKGASMDPLITINRTIMEGLSQTPA
jgi:flagellar protein FlaF